VPLSITEAEPKPAPTAPHKRRWGRIVVVLIIAFLVALFVPPSMNLHRFAGDYARTMMERAIGRKVNTNDVRVLVLPPGFVLNNVSIAEDPAFGSEPVIRTEELTATLRLSSLWRGRMEIASISLSNPSLNVVRSKDGRWNIQALLLRAAETPTAPTTKRTAEARPRFPYISADSGRIDFKLGNEKMVYAVSDADFSLWLESEDEWRMRLKGRLVRADMNLTDLGTVSMTGSFARSRGEHDNVISLTGRLENAQLGQLSQYVTGHDHGWRGTVDVDATAAGSARLLTLAASVNATDFHRYDIIGGNSLALRVRCTGNYAQESLRNIDCHAPAGQGDLAARGSIDSIFEHPQFGLSVVADHVPAQAVVSFLQHAKAGLPHDVTAVGAFNGAFTWRTPPVGGPAVWSGGGASTPLHIASGVIGAPIDIPKIQYVVAPVAPGSVGRAPNAHPQLALDILPFSFAADQPAPLVVSGSLDGQTYRLFIRGNAGLPRLVSLAQLAGVRALRFTGNGAANMDLQIAGQWAGFAPPEVTGTAALRDVQANVPGLPDALVVSTANVALDANLVSVTNLNLGVNGSPLSLAGSLSFPRHCERVEDCPAHFVLSTNQLSADELVRVLDPDFHARPWYANLVGANDRLPRFVAEGTLSAARLQIKNLTATNVAMDVRIARNIVQVEHLRGELFGGAHRGGLTLDFSTPQPEISASGDLQGFSVAELAALTHSNWGSGTAALTYHFSMRGRTARDLLGSAAGDADFDWKQGALRGIALPRSPAPLRFRHFSGTLALKNAQLEFTAGKLLLPDGIYEVKGTASFGRQVDLRLVRDHTHAYAIGGTLDRPQVRPLEPAREAALRR
jgi:uncharacterized protein involved in outer membrane biogenesis